MAGYEDISAADIGAVLQYLESRCGFIGEDGEIVWISREDGAEIFAEAERIHGEQLRRMLRADEIR